MNKSSLLVTSVILCLGLALISLQNSDTANKLDNDLPDINASTTVSSLLIAYGEPKPLHHVEVDPEKANKGEEIIKQGYTTNPEGERFQRVSLHFVCTDCHNLGPESKDPANLDPDDRLQYAGANDIPYLPGSTFWGITDRTSWFNDDYYKKYGDLVYNAQDTLWNAVQLCSRECSQGRCLEVWELEAVIHYLTTLQLKLGDLTFTDQEWQKMKNYRDNPEYKQEMIEVLKSKYVTAYPATFVKEVPVEERGMGKKGDPDKGKIIYHNSCMHCHKEGGVTETVFSEDDVDAEWLISYFHKNNGGSIYFITRHGTEPSRRTPEYMPIYTQEKLNNQHLEDLAAYIVEMNKQ